MMGWRFLTTGKLFRARCYLACCLLWFGQIKNKNNTIWRHRDCNANILGCVFCLCVRCFFVELVPFFPTMVKTQNRSITSPFLVVLFSNHFITACCSCCPWLPSLKGQPFNLFVPRNSCNFLRQFHSCTRSSVRVGKIVSVVLLGWRGFDEFGGARWIVSWFWMQVVWMLWICVVEIEVETLPLYWFYLCSQANLTKLLGMIEWYLVWTTKFKVFHGPEMAEWGIRASFKNGWLTPLKDLF